MALLSEWTWDWANPRRSWRTRKPGMLQSTGPQTGGTWQRLNNIWWSNRALWYLPEWVENFPYNYLYIIFVAALFIIAKTWKQPRCLLIDEWTNCGMQRLWRWEERWRGIAQRIFRTVKLSCMTLLCGIHVTKHLSKLIECITPRVTLIQTGLWVIIHCMFTNRSNVPLW